MRLRGLLYDARESRGQLGCRLISSLFRQRGVAGEIQERDRRRLSRLPRSDASLLHEAFGHGDDVLEHRVLPVPGLEPGDEAADELGESRGLLVDEAVLLLVRELEGPDTLANRSVEELEARGDESLHGAAVEPGEARELLLIRQIESRDDE